MEYKLLAIAVIFTVAMAPQMTYSAYTNRPYFVCPDNVFQCALYQTTNRWVALDQPILRETCEPGQVCQLVSLSEKGNSIRWLPGDIWMSAFRFEGWALYEYGQNPYPDVQPEPQPDPEPQPEICTKVCRNRSIHGICTGYKLVCEPVA